jgi:hypothetical protein
MRLELYKDARLTRDLPEHRLRQGDLVKLVDQHVAPNGMIGYSAELLNALGDTLDVITISQDDLEPLGEGEILCARAF